MAASSLKKVVRQNVHLIGAVKNIIFPREEPHVSGQFAIFTAIVREDTSLHGFSATLTGNSLPEIIIGQSYNIVADEIIDPRYGQQYEIQRMNSIVEWTSTKQVGRYLSTILTDAQTRSLMKHFPNPIEVLENGDKAALMTIPGIGEVTAERILTKYLESKDNALAYTELYTMGLTKNMIDKLVERYHSADIVVDKILNHPYDLIKEVRGIGWKKADEWAKKAGIAENSPDRIKAFFYYHFEDKIASLSATYDHLRGLFDATKELSPLITEEMLKKCLDEEVEAGNIYYEPETQRVALMSAYQLEKKIARELIRLKMADSIMITGLDDIIAQCEREVGFEYSDEQKDAIRRILNNNVSLLTAKGGCGKSASMFPVVRAMKSQGLKVLQCCLSGRAALNLSDATGIEGMTIHRMLGWIPKVGFKYNKNNRLKTNMVILDEVSMVGGEIFLSLLEAIPSGAKLVMVGDFGQLEPIGVGNVGYDISASGVIPHSHLTQIFRQAKMSGIITESAKIYNGEHIISNNFRGTEIRGILQDLKIVCCPDAQSCFTKVISEFKRLYFDEHIPVADIAICAAKRSSGALSTRIINEAIQKYVPVPEGSKSICFNYTDAGTQYELCLREGDKVAVIENQYNTINTANQPEPIFNGNVGVITEINYEKKHIIVQFPHAEVIIINKYWSSLRLGYAITTHRAQGIGVPYVIAVADPSAYTLLSKELLYTQLTRAKKFCTLIGTAWSIRFATETTRVRHKETWLKELLIQENESPTKETNDDLILAVTNDF